MRICVIDCAKLSTCMRVWNQFGKLGGGGNCHDPQNFCRVGERFCIT